MNCNLVKKINRFEGNDEVRSYANYYLVFDNGAIIPITPRYYKTSSTKKEDIEKFERMNNRNAIKLDTLATLIKDKE